MAEVITELTLSTPIVKEPELRFTGEGMSVCSLIVPIEVNSKEEGLAPCWLKCTAFGALAEKLNQLNVGETILLQGRLSGNRWETPEGDKRSTIDMIIIKAGKWEGFTVGVKWFEIEKEPRRPGLRISPKPAVNKPKDLTDPVIQALLKGEPSEDKETSDTVES